MGMKISVTPESRKIGELLREWPERTERFLHYFAYVAASQSLARIKSKMPSKAEWKRYKHALHVTRVSGVSAYAIKAETKRGGRGRQREPAKEVVYVRATKRRKRRDRTVTVLEKYNPWTWDTLPFTPGRSDAVIVTRRVREREMTKVAEARKGDKRKWQKELSAAGARVRKRNLANVKVPKRKAKVVPDLAFEALRLEFGLGGSESKAHWRPGIRGFLKSLPRIGRRKEIIRTFTDPKYSGWKMWPPKAKGQVNVGEARKFAPFQKRLGIK